MKKSTALLITIIVLNVGTFCQAEEDPGYLGFSFDLTYTSKWLSKGVEAYGSKGGLFKTIDVDFWQTGWGVKVTHRNATSSGYVDSQRFDFRPYYKGLLFDGERYQTNYNLSVGYEHYPGLSRHKANTTYEWIFAFSWPKLLPCGLVPGYIAHYEYPASGGDVNRKVAGWVHRFLLGYDLKMEELPNPLHLSTEVAYYDGLGNKCHDWAYFTIGMSSKFNITEDLAFVPGVYLQRTMDRSISKHKDIAYTMLSMKYVF
ncbi:MAG: hypothetical protein JW804_07315 [Sedimentisphaerales bacterium]|nr:hypothetical protein [Sedimentisphaerales bacterium]